MGESRNTIQKEEKMKKKTNRIDFSHIKNIISAKPPTLAPPITERDTVNPDDFGWGPKPSKKIVAGRKHPIKRKKKEEDESIDIQELLAYLKEPDVDNGKNIKVRCPDCGADLTLKIDLKFGNHNS